MTSKSRAVIAHRKSAEEQAKHDPRKKAAARSAAAGATGASSTGAQTGAKAVKAGKSAVPGFGAVDSGRKNAYDVERIRRDFPILATKVHGQRLVYLDNAATTQKPKQVIDRITKFYQGENSNIHRGVHHLSEVATKAFEGARADIARFVGGKRSSQLVFTRGTTEAINLVARSFVRPRLHKGDEILVTNMEHHSNIVPWQLLCQETGATLKVVPITDQGELEPGAFERLLTPRTKFASFVHISNALGTVNPVAEMVAAAHAKKVPVLVDGAQAVAHATVDFERLGADFYAFSGHKMYGPTGIGALIAKPEHLEVMPPYQGGGDMIKSVSFEHGTTFNEVPHKFEAGTPDIAGGIGLGAAAQYIDGIGRDRIAAHEHKLLSYATQELANVPGLRIIGTAREKAAVVSFALGNIHPHDVGSLLDRDGIAIRTGHHCAQPVMERFQVPATCRASFACYNTEDEVDVLVHGLQKVVKLFA